MKDRNQLVNRKDDPESGAESPRMHRSASETIENAIVQYGTLVGQIEFLGNDGETICKEYYVCPQLHRRVDTSKDTLDPSTAEQIVNSTNEVYEGIRKAMDDDPNFTYYLERLTQPASIFDTSQIYEVRLPILRAMSADLSVTGEIIPTHFNVWILPNLTTADLIHLSMKKEINALSIDIPGFSKLHFFNAIDSRFLAQMNNLGISPE